MNPSKIAQIFLGLNQSRVPASLDTLKVSAPPAVKVAAATANLDDFVEDLKAVLARRPYQNCAFNESRQRGGELSTPSSLFLDGSAAGPHASGIDMRVGAR